MNMELSSRVRYALLALLELASHYDQGDYLQIDQIAVSQQISDRYLAQLLMSLRRCGIVRSQRGAKGGYALAKEPRKITMPEVLTCLEGSKNWELESQTASATPETAAIESVWQEATTAASSVFQRHTLQDLLEKRDESQRSNPMYYI
jgi:Rrf2 family protein